MFVAIVALSQIILLLFPYVLPFRINYSTWFYSCCSMQTQENNAATLLYFSQSLSIG